MGFKLFFDFCWVLRVRFALFCFGDSVVLFVAWFWLWFCVGCWFWFYCCFELVSCGWIVFCFFFGVLCIWVFGFYSGCWVLWFGFALGWFWCWVGFNFVSCLSLLWFLGGFMCWRVVGFAYVLLDLFLLWFGLFICVLDFPNVSVWWIDLFFDLFFALLDFVLDFGLTYAWYLCFYWFEDCFVFIGVGAFYCCVFDCLWIVLFWLLIVFCFECGVPLFGVGIVFAIGWCYVCFVVCGFVVCLTFVSFRICRISVFFTCWFWSVW